MLAPLALIATTLRSVSIRLLALLGYCPCPLKAGRAMVRGSLKTLEFVPLSTRDYARPTNFDVSSILEMVAQTPS